MISRSNLRKYLPLTSLALPLWLLLCGAKAQQKEATAIVSAACSNELQSDRNDHTPFMYFDHDVTPDHDTLFYIIETPDGNLKKKIEDHGHPLSPEDRQQDDDRIHRLLSDPALQEKLKRDSAHDDEQAEQLLKLLPTAFLWTIVSENGDLVTLDFKPDPNFSPDTMEARVFSDMAGQIVVSRSENRIRSMKGRMVDDVKIGPFAIIGRLHKGGTFQVEHREVAPHHWQLTELHVHIVGHILFNFKTIGSQEDEIKTDYKISPAQTLQQAYELMNSSAALKPMLSSAKPRSR
jgi:hypothetical protein